MEGPIRSEIINRNIQNILLVDFLYQCFLISVKATEILFKDVADLHYKQWIGKNTYTVDLIQDFHLF